MVLNTSTDLEQVYTIESNLSIDVCNQQISCPRSLHFGALAWGSAFYSGVHKGLEERFGNRFYTQLESVHGDSAGVIFALGICLGKSADFMDQLYKTLSEKASREGIAHNTKIVNDAIDSLLDDELTYLKVKDRLTIGVTEFPLHHVRYSSWASNDDLRRCLHGSMYLPLYCQIIEPVNNKYVIDGGFSFAGEYLSHGNETLFIGIDPNAEISGEMSLLEMAFPMINEKYVEVVEMGRKSILNWNGEMKDKVKHRKKNPVGLVFWPLIVISYLWAIISKLLDLLSNYNKES